MSAPEPGSGPWFAVTMTVRNNASTIGDSLASFLPLAPHGGELVVVDAESTDGTREILERVAAEHPEVSVLVRACNRGVGRNLAARASHAPVVLTQVDGDNRYAPGVLVAVASFLRARPELGLVFSVGAGDRDPSLTRFYAWRRDAFEQAGGYPDTQEREDPPLLLRAFRAGFGIGRCVVPRGADDLKPRPGGWAPTVSPWRRGAHTATAARKFRVMGFRFPEYARLLWLTRRTTPRLVAGLLLGAGAYVQGALRRDGLAFLQQDDLVAKDLVTPPPAPTPPGGSR